MLLFSKITGQANLFRISIVIGLNMALACQNPNPKAPPDTPFAVVLGIAQDAGFPQADCRKDCCKLAWENSELRRRTASLGIIDPRSGERWIIDATPDFKDQLWHLNSLVEKRDDQPLTGVLLTHAHIGHYTGLMQLGFEAIGTKKVPVYAMPRMQRYLSFSGPWDQLIRFENIVIVPIENGIEFKLNDRISVTPFLVPHRDEYTETVGYRISGPRKSIVYIPDIDKWEKWQKKIEDAIASCDRAYLDGSFYLNDEVQGREMSEFPHPFIVESMARFKNLADSEKQKVTFLHFNHTNPVLRKDSQQAEEVKQRGFRIAKQGEKYIL
jgi:pyrroloquinoline quinone biosynthesis protein B